MPRAEAIDPAQTERLQAVVRNAYLDGEGDGARSNAAIAWAVAGLAPGATQFDRAVRPVLGQVCLGCHNDKLQSGGLNVAGFLDSASLKNNREGYIIELRSAGNRIHNGVTSGDHRFGERFFHRCNMVPVLSMSLSV